MNSATSWINASRLEGIQISRLRQMMAAAPRDAINLALGELAFDFPLCLRDKAKRLMDSGNPAYTPNAGILELRAAVASYLGLEGASNILICNGAEEALYIALQGIANPGDTVAIPDPDYPAYPTLARLAGAKVTRIPFTPNLKCIDWERWEISLSGAKALLLSHPSNPTGFCFSPDDFHHLSELLNRLGIILIIDEIYTELFLEQPIALDYSKVERVIRIGGLSKSHLMSGWRVGWLAADETAVTQFTKLKQYISTCAAWPSQVLALYAINQPEIVAGVREQLRDNLSLCREQLSRFELKLPTAGPYLMLKCGDGDSYAEALLKQGVICVPGSAFGELTEEYIRINFGVRTDVLCAALKRFL